MANSNVAENVADRFVTWRTDSVQNEGEETLECDTVNLEISETGPTAPDMNTACETEH